jgi:hypothetical protein
MKKNFFKFTLLLMLTAFLSVNHSFAQSPADENGRIEALTQQLENQSHRNSAFYFTVPFYDSFNCFEIAGEL